MAPSAQAALGPMKPPVCWDRSTSGDLPRACRGEGLGLCMLGLGCGDQRPGLGVWGLETRAWDVGGRGQGLGYVRCRD